MTDKTVLDQQTIGVAAQVLADQIHGNLRHDYYRLFGVPRGGIPAAYAVAHHLSKVCSKAVLVDRAEDAMVVIDDLIDSGKTRERYSKQIFGALFVKGEQKNGLPFLFGTRMAAHKWLVFPWEASVEGSAEDIVTRLLQFIGEDPQRGGLLETPARVLKAWRNEWASGYGKDPKDVLKAFKDGGEKYDELILVRDIPVYTHCEHHLAPFFGVAHVAYIPDGRIVGLSKLSRLVDIFAKRLQVQERLTAQVADTLYEELKPKGVGVVFQCRHLCMESRGIAKQGSVTTTSKVLGALYTKPEARAEFFSLIGRANGV